MSIHSKHDTREYSIYHRIKQSCTNPNHPSYRRYGAKGIKLCEEWGKFVNFYNDMEKMPDDCNTIFVKDTSVEFCKMNCYWGKRSSGRPKKKHTQIKKMRTRTKKQRIVTFTMDDDLYEYINKQAIKKSVEVGSLIKTNDLIRSALLSTFPIPTQVDMFGLSFHSNYTAL